MRKTFYLSILAVVLVAVLGAAVVACGGSSSSSTTASSVGESTTTTGGSTTTVTGETSTTASGETTTTAPGETTTSVTESTTTTEAARTTDTADHAQDFKSQYPSTESFDNSTWATVNSDPAAHLGAAADLKGTAANVTVDPDSKYLTWEFTVADAAGTQMKVLCRTNLNIDRTLLSGGGTLEVKGIVTGAQSADAGGGAIIYVETVQKAS